MAARRETKPPEPCYLGRVPDELTRALLVEDVAQPAKIGEALFVSVTRDVPLVRALETTGAAPSDVLARYLGRSPAPFLRQVIPVADLVDRLPPGLCARLLAIPVRRDAITGTVDVVVADASDPHPGAEIAFHLRAPVRVIRAPVGAIEEALVRIRRRAQDPSDATGFDSRPFSVPPSAARASVAAPAVRDRPSVAAPPAAASTRPSAVPAATSMQGAMRPRRDTPTWGTPVHRGSRPDRESDVPRSSADSEIPIPLTRRAFGPVAGGTQRPPPLVNPADSGLGEGYPLAYTSLTPAVEVARDRMPSTPSQFPPPPALPTEHGPEPRRVSPAPAGVRALAPQLPFADAVAVLAALRTATSRDEVLELLLRGGRAVAARVALFVVKRGGYLGWACNPEFGDRVALQSVLIPLDSQSVFDTAVREDVYLGPIRTDDVHAPLLAVMKTATRDVALVPVRVSGKTAVILVADDLGDTMTSTRRLEELADAAGEAFVRIVRGKR